MLQIAFFCPTRYSFHMIIYAATGNAHKKSELQGLFNEHEIRIPKDEGISFDPEENGLSFIENSVIKARALYNIVKKPVIADDSGICVDVLNGKPGIFSARYQGRNKDYSEDKLSDSERNMLLLEEAEYARKKAGLPDDTPLSCRFVCAMVLYFGNEQFYAVQETLEGQLVSSIDMARGNGGFGYDPILFIPSLNKTVAELSPEEKNLVSHRGKAAKRLKEITAQFF